MTEAQLALTTTNAVDAKLGIGPTHVRYGVLALLATGTLINYLDRTVLGIASPMLTRDLHLDPAVMGLIFSAFSWTYVLAQIPGGLFLDKFGTRLTYFLALFFWSICTAMQGFSHGLSWLFSFRLGLGISESPCFPANSRVVATWFPRSERAMATGVYTVGEYVGLALFSPLLFAIMQHWGWRSLFYGVGALGVGFSALWWLCFREPDQSKRANEQELAYIAAGGGLLQKKRDETPLSLAVLGSLLKKRQLAGICIGQFGSNSTLVFFLTWFPTYLATARHMAWLKLGFFAIFPFVAASVGVLLGGWLSDALLRAGHSINLARKLPIISGLLLASGIIAANHVQSDRIVIAILSVAFFAQGMAALGWTIVSDIAPEGLLGVTGGVFNLAANLAGIITPIVIGVIISRTGSFVYALAYIGAVALLGALSYIFLVGDIHRIVLSEPTA